MSSRLLALWLALALLVALLPREAQGAKGRGGKRGRGRMRSSGSARYIFYTHPKRKEYYDNPNVRTPLYHVQWVHVSGKPTASALHNQPKMADLT